MDETSKNLVDSELVGKYLAGEASPEEVLLLEDWIAMSATNRLLFQQYLSTWEGAEAGKAYQLPDKTAVWNRFTSSTSGKSSGRVISLPRRYWIAAAIAVIVLGSIIPIIYFDGGNSKESEQKLVIASHHQVKQSNLPDGSSIILNSNSSVEFAREFTTDQRQATLKGEAYFDIVHDPSRPFIIGFEDVSIVVLGTSFNVRKNAKDNTIETQVSSGRVRMYNQGGEIVISAGETGIYRQEQNSFALQKTLDINSLSYATKNFVFSDEPLSSIIGYLSTAYSKKIVLRNSAVGNCKMTSSFNNKSIEYILEVISTTLDVKYTIEGDTIYIVGGEHGGC